MMKIFYACSTPARRELRVSRRSPKCKNPWKYSTFCFQNALEIRCSIQLSYWGIFCFLIILDLLLLCN